MTPHSWDTTQQWIALAVTGITLVVAAWMAIVGTSERVQTAAMVFLFGVANLVVGFYFGRVNGAGRR